MELKDIEEEYDEKVNCCSNIPQQQDNVVRRWQKLEAAWIQVSEGDEQ